MNFQGKVALITGASSGVGEAIARNIDAAGMKLVLTARSKEKLQDYTTSGAKMIRNTSPLAVRYNLRTLLAICGSC